jgi:glucose dehydrogenase
VFAGSHEGYFYALDADTGADLFHVYLGGDGLGGIGGAAAMYAAPITYEVNGKQYVSMSAGSALFTFTLPE